MPNQRKYIFFIVFGVLWVLWANSVKGNLLNLSFVQDTVLQTPSDSIVKPIQKFTQTGLASYYANKFHGRRTANGERYSKYKLTAAHRTLPFGTMVKVTEVKTGKWLVVRINDRGPHVRKRVIDLSYAAAKQFGMVKGSGVIKVKLKVVEWPAN